jgi:tubulin polyglutamylase TTLL6/13
MEIKTKVKKKPVIVCNVAFTQYPVVKHVTEKILGWKLTEDEKDEKWDLLWTDHAVPPERLSKMQHYQKINHFPGMYSISRKNYLAMNLSKLKKKFQDDYNFYPKTWLYPSDSAEIKTFLQSTKDGFLIVKPEASCQGRGIFLTKRFENIDINGKFVVQEYMKNPFLIDGLKFDLRIYVLVTGCSPLRIFVHEDGLTRLATQEYLKPNASNIEDMWMHLTNYAVNKNNPNFIQNENKGHKRSLKSTFEYLQQAGFDVELLKNQIDDAIIKTLCSIQPTLSHHYKSCQPEDLSNSMCFELLGFDVILDNKAKPFILEVNHTPSFSTDSPLDWKIKSKVIRDSLVLMNVTARERKAFLKKQKELIFKRAVTGKVEKESKEDKGIRALHLKEKRDDWENRHLGKFRKIFNGNEEKYQKFLDFADQVYQDMTGANLSRNKKFLNEKNLKSPRKLTKIDSNVRDRCNSIPMNESKLRSAVFERLSKPSIKKFKSSNSPLLPPLIYYDEEKLHQKYFYSTRIPYTYSENKRDFKLTPEIRPPRLFNFQLFKTFAE